MTLANEAGFVLLANPDWTQDMLNHVKGTTKPQDVNKDYAAHEHQLKAEGLIALHLRTGDWWCLDVANDFMKRYIEVAKTGLNLLYTTFNPVTGTKTGYHHVGLISHILPIFALLGKYYDPAWLTTLKDIVEATEGLRPATGLIHGGYNTETGAVTLEEYQPTYAEYGEALTFLHKVTKDAYYLDKLEAHIDNYIKHAWDEDIKMFLRVSPDTGVPYPDSEQYCYAWSHTIIVPLLHLYHQGKGDKYLEIAEEHFWKLWQIHRENSLIVNQVYFLPAYYSNNHYSKLHAEFIRAGLELYFTTRKPLYKQVCGQYFWWLMEKAKRAYGFPEIRTDDFTNWETPPKQPEYVWESIILMWILEEWEDVFDTIYPKVAISLFEVLFIP